jgi:hypothetical protein
LRLTPEVRAVITDPGESGAKTTREWEEFILQAKIAWHVHQESTRRDSQGIWEGSNKDDASSVSGVYLLDEPTNFMFAEPQEFGNLEFTPPGKGWGEDLGEKKDNDLQAVRKAIKDLDYKMCLVLVSVRADQVGVTDHLWSSIVKLGSATEGLHARVWGIEQDIGDALDLLDEHNLRNLSKGVLQALGQLSPSTISNPGLQDINNKIADLIDLINVVNEDHQKTGRYLLTKLSSTPPTPVLASRAPGVGSLGALNLGMAIVDDAGGAGWYFGPAPEGFGTGS